MVKSTSLSEMPCLPLQTQFLLKFVTIQDQSLVCHFDHGKLLTLLLNCLQNGQEHDNPDCSAVAIWLAAASTAVRLVHSALLCFLAIGVAILAPIFRGLRLQVPSVQPRRPGHDCAKVEDPQHDEHGL